MTAAEITCVLALTVIIHHNTSEPGKPVAYAMVLKTKSI